jgi:hypothetical protein
MSRERIIEEITARRLAEAGPHHDEKSRTWIKAGVAENLEEFCAAIPGLADVLDGKAVVVPVNATAEMQEDIWLAAQLQNANSQYAAMLAASPYRRPE